MTTVLITDYDAPPSTSTIYRARGLIAADLVGGVIAGDWSSSSTSASWTIATDTTTCDGTMAWLKNPLVPEQNMLVRLGAGALMSKVRRISRGVFRPLGRVNAVAVTDVRYSIETDLTIITMSSIEAAGVRALFDAASTLLLQCPDAFGWESAYVSPGDLTEEHMFPVITRGERRFTVPLTVTDAPVGLVP